MLPLAFRPPAAPSAPSPRAFSPRPSALSAIALLRLPWRAVLAVATLTDHGITSPAQFYTSKIKYDPDQFATDSAELRALLQERGFLS